jgi:uncharacterized lipoprotein
MSFQRFKIIVSCAAALLLSACAFTPHDLALYPSTSVSPSTVGSGTKVYFRFVDDRDDTVVGVRGARAMGAKIAAPTLPAVAEARLKEGLQTKGYALVSDEQASDDTVTYRMRSFKFNVETGFWSGSDNVSAVLAVDALKNGKTYSNVYRFNSQHSAQVVPAGEDLDLMMNRALSDILQQAVTDSALDKFLTGKN